MLYLSFIGCRILFQPILWVASILPYFVWVCRNNFSAGYIALCLLMGSTVAFNTGLNFYWFWLI